MEDQDKKPKPPVSKWKFRLILFAVYFFRSFIFLFIISVVFLIVGIFRRECLIIGAVLLAIDFIISIYFAIRTSRMQGSHEMFNMILKAARNEGSSGNLDGFTNKENKEDLYSEKAHELRHEASEAKTVREVFELYKKDIASLALTDETYTVYVKKEKYFFDDQMHYVISFDRMREINDDIEQHLYMDILFAPDKFDSRIENTFEGKSDGGTAEFFEQVGQYLESNELMGLTVDDINVGASY